MSGAMDEITCYEICVQGHIPAHWADLFDGLTLQTSFASNGVPITALTGAIVDQSALSGLLIQISDMNLKLISVNPMQENE